MYPIVDIIPDIDNVQERLTTRAAAKEIIEKSLDEAKVSYKSKNWKITMKRG